MLLDDGNHTEPTYQNIIDAYKTIVSQSEKGDCIFLHYSGELLCCVAQLEHWYISFWLLKLNWNLSYPTGHGTKIRDDDSGEECDGYDEALCPRDFQSAGMIRDDDRFDILVKPLADGVHMVSLMDCCHSGMYWELPRLFVVIPCFNLWCWLVIPPW